MDTTWIIATIRAEETRRHHSPAAVLRRMLAALGLTVCLLAALPAMADDAGAIHGHGIRVEKIHYAPGVIVGREVIEQPSWDSDVAPADHMHALPPRCPSPAEPCPCWPMDFVGVALYVGIGVAIGVMLMLLAAERGRQKKEPPC